MGQYEYKEGIVIILQLDSDGHPFLSIDQLHKHYDLIHPH